MPAAKRTRPRADATPPTRDDLLTVQQVCAELGIGRDKVRHLVRLGVFERLPHVHRVLIPRRCVDEFVNGSGPK